MSNPSRRGLLKGPNNGILILGDRVLLWGRGCALAWVFSRARIPASEETLPTRHGPLAPEGTSNSYSVQQVAPERLEWYPLYHTGTRSRSLRVVF
jgi:hypothetical protein